MAEDLNQGAGPETARHQYTFRDDGRISAMASVFTFDADPPRVSSPWPNQSVTDGKDGQGPRVPVSAGGGNPPVMELADCGITRLESEPQEGPTEYKLHLLLRPRRSFVASSTLQRVSGSHQSKSGSVRVDSQPESKLIKPSRSPKPSSQSRQNRLQNLTTQLLWRLQQSSPYHSSSKAGLVVPVLPEDRIKSTVADGPDGLLPGLEESQGALYEIGVSDDGAFVGLTEDELEESLTTLRAMAFSLGCKVEVLRKVLVGDCHWVDDPETTMGPATKIHHDNLLVAEALVTPNLDFGKQAIPAKFVPFDDVPLSSLPSATMSDEFSQVESQTEQLRISLTGSTTSGKSSLLGTLSTSTLDNGRGKSRLSLLKHRHEIVSGISSSVTPELIGYQDSFASTARTNVINYASGNVSSWNDIHSASEPGRLVLATDSAGHPRYRRTMMRGLISWAPHWTIFCIAADADGDHHTTASATAFSQETLGPAAIDADLATTHLSLCLKLKLPLVVVITKLDLASRAGLRKTLNTILSTVKAVGRRPHMLPTTTVSDQDPQLQSLGVDDEEAVRSALASCHDDDINLLVPIVLTSTVNGTGISKLHALLRHLPLLSPGHWGQNDSSDGNPVPDTLFHVDEVFTMPESHLHSNPSVAKSVTGTVLSGHLRYGDVSIGDELLVGPFTVDGFVAEASKVDMRRVSSSPGITKGSCQDLKMSHEEHQHLSEGDSARSRKETLVDSAWRKVRVESLRNLRLPVRKLLAGQVGTVGISWGYAEKTADGHESTSYYRLRKGMVMIDPPNASSYGGFCASFDADNAVSITPGSMVIVYIASIRTATKIVSIRPAPAAAKSRGGVFCFDGDDVSDSDGGVEISDSSSSQQQQEMEFRLLTSREWIELGTLVLVMPGGGGGGGLGTRAVASGRGEGGSSGLDGFVGRVTSVFE